MLKFHKNKPQTFKCRIEIQGEKNPNVTPRLILSPNDSNIKVFYEGKFSDNQCEIKIPSLLDIKDRGALTLEVIANNTVFQPWKSTYEIVSNKMVVEGVELLNDKEEISVSLVEDSIKETKEFDNNYLLPLKNYKSKRGILRYIKENYKPNKKVINWAKEEFGNSKGLKIKTAMFFKEKRGN